MGPKQKLSDPAGLGRLNGLLHGLGGGLGRPAGAWGGPARAFTGSVLHLLGSVLHLIHGSANTKENIHHSTGHITQNAYSDRAEQGGAFPGLPGHPPPAYILRLPDVILNSTGLFMYHTGIFDSYSRLPNTLKLYPRQSEGLE